MEIFYFFVTILTMVMIYSILTLGLNLHWGFTGLLNFGHAAFFAIGAYTSAILTLPPTADFPLGMGLPFLVGLVGAIIMSGFMAFLVGLPTLRLTEDYLAIMSIGLAETIRYALENEEWLTRGQLGLRDIPRPIYKFWTAHFSVQSYDIFYAILVLVVLIILYFVAQHTVRIPFGRVLKGIREDEVVTESLGKNIYWAKMRSFVLGSVFAGIAGCLYTHFITCIMPHNFEPGITFMVWMALILGGSGNNKGALLGAFLLFGLLEQGTRFLPAIPGKGYLIPAIRFMIIGALAVVMLRFRPEGIMGERILK